MRFTLSKLFLSVAMVGLACAGMVHRSDLWAAGIVTLSFLLFTAVAIRAFGLRQRAQAFAIAFAAVGILYLVIVMCSRQFGQCAIITNYPLAFVARIMHVEISSGRTYSPNGAMSPSTIQPEDSLGTIIVHAAQTDATASLGHFFIIGHCIWAWLFAIVAGTTAGYMRAKCDAQQVS